MDDFSNEGWVAYGELPRPQALQPSLPISPIDGYLAIEIHGSVWRELPEWQVVQAKHDSATDMLAVIIKNDRRNLMKAGLFYRFDNGCWPKAVWETVNETFFGPNDLANAVEYLEALLRNQRD
ncbi:MAG TPA: hypothetical protein VGN12_22510 [Pirellulales bacterium]|jgi:hypothetical protein